ncbi:MAG: hypothetical protein DCF31_13750 [Alphaproteobacteria bacterium]|nr:MAG: hypothetical protein DCF31_13750 [Alphaproteobacteria bacterium]
MLVSRKRSSIDPGARGFHQAIADPGAVYSDPAAILADARLNRRQQLKLLVEWTQQLLDHHVAETEHPSFGGTLSGAQDADLLRQLGSAIGRLEAETGEGGPGVVKRLWQRLKSPQA